MTATEVLIDGLHFPEAPRWRDGWLWFSDIYGDSVGRVSAEGKFEELFDVAGRPSGLGWLPDGRLPDGCCLDAAGGIWVASPMSDGEVVRILEGGEITHRIRARKDPFACMLGGDDRRTLFICSAENADEEHCRNHATGAIEIARVEWPGAGLP